MSAVAITSAGAPCWICVTNAPDPAKLYVRFKPGFATFNVVCRSLNDSVNDAAANTVTEPVSFGAADDADDPAPVAVGVLLSELHAAAASNNDNVRA